jgi:hypothetical protein
MAPAVLVRGLRKTYDDVEGPKHSPAASEEETRFRSGTRLSCDRSNDPSARTRHAGAPTLAV